MKPLLALSLLLLSGCAQLSTGIERAGDVADRVLAENESALCSKRFSLRAYEQRYGARWDELVAFCGWNRGVPAPEQE